MFVLLLAFLNFSYADEQAITLQKGDKAPFAGTLLSQEAAAKVLLTSQSDLQTCLIDAKRDKAVQEADFQLQLAKKEAALAACTLQASKKEAIYEDHIEYLEKRAVEPSWKAPVMFTTGVIAGIGVVMGSAWVLEKIGD